MVKAFILDLKLDTTVPGNVWIAGNILGRLVGCYYIGGIGFLNKPYELYDIINFI